MNIRPIESKDFPQLIQLFKEFAEFEKLPDHMTNSAQQMLDEKEWINGFVVCNSSDIIIGYATYFFAYYTWVGKSLYMDDLYITPTYRGNGFGSQLIKMVSDKAKAEKCKRLRWQVSDWNKPAIKFYESLGAKISPTESNCDILL